MPSRVRDWLRTSRQKKRTEVSHPSSQVTRETSVLSSVFPFSSSSRSSVSLDCPPSKLLVLVLPAKEEKGTNRYRCVHMWLSHPAYSPCSSSLFWSFPSLSPDDELTPHSSCPPIPPTSPTPITPITNGRRASLHQAHPIIPSPGCSLSGRCGSQQSHEIKSVVLYPFHRWECWDLKSWKDISWW